MLKETQRRLRISSAISNVSGKMDRERILVFDSYSVCTGGPLSYAQPWWADHGFGDLDLDAPRISELLPRLDEDLQNTFFKGWINRQGSGRTLCDNITSVSSHGKNNDLIEWGYNRDKEKLQQMNLALLSGRDNGLPLWYTPLSGSLNDTKSLTSLVDELEKLECGKFALVMEQGFIQQGEHQLFGGQGDEVHNSQHRGWHKKLTHEHRTRMFSNVDGYIPSAEGGRLLQSVTIYRLFEDGSKGWVHIYYDSEIRGQVEQSFMEEYKKRYEEFVSGILDPDHREYYEACFKSGNHTKNGLKVIAKKDPVQVFSEDISGYWCIHTNAEKDAAKALSAYRRRGDIEQLFDDLKNTLNCNRLKVQTKASIQGRLFIQFIALILLTELKKMIRENSDELSKYGSATARSSGG